MPTLNTIPIHKTLRRKLENLDEAEDPNSNPTNAALSVPDPSSKKVKVVSIHTPHALLSRDPNQIRDHIGPNVPINAILDLRSSIADALINDKHNGHGKESWIFQDRINLLLSNSNDNNSEWLFLNQLRTKKAFIEGSCTALDYCIHASFDLLMSFPENDETHQSESLPFQSIDENICNISTIPTGSKQLDQLLSPPPSSIAALHSTFKQYIPNSNKTHTPGLAFGLVTEVTGPPASGKTQLALTLASNAAKQKMTVHYLASGGGNSTIVPLARRLLNILRSTNVNHSNLLFTQILERVTFHTVTDGYQALTKLTEIQQTIEGKNRIRNDCDSEIDTSNSNDQFRKYRNFKNSRILLIFDSASGCLSPNIAGSRIDGGVGSALMNQVGIMLRRMARINNHAVFVTNGSVGKPLSYAQMHNNDNQSSSTIAQDIFKQPAMRNMWKIADIRVCFGILEDCNLNQRDGIGVRKIRAILDKHFAKSCNPQKCSAPERNIELAITLAGICDV